jgi:hypothetical protein
MGSFFYQAFGNNLRAATTRNADLWFLPSERSSVEGRVHGRLRHAESRQACRENDRPGETDQFERVKGRHRSALSSLDNSAMQFDM